MLIVCIKRYQSGELVCNWRKIGLTLPLSDEAVACSVTNWEAMLRLHKVFRFVHMERDRVLIV